MFKESYKKITYNIFKTTSYFVPHPTHAVQSKQLIELPYIVATTKTQWSKLPNTTNRYFTTPFPVEELRVLN